MAFIINPGSKIGAELDGWTNTHETAKFNAIKWFLEPMKKQGFTDLVMKDIGEERDGRWLFIFKHLITNKEIELEIHGIDDTSAYEKKYIFTPRVYWDGDSSGTPELEQFAADGFTPVMTFRASEETK